MLDECHIIVAHRFEDPALAAHQRLIALREKCSVGDVVSPSGEEWDDERGRL
jgi:hypothetical protein